MSLLSVLRHSKSYTNYFLEDLANHPNGRALREYFRENFSDREVGLTDEGKQLAYLLKHLSLNGKVNFSLLEYEVVITTGYKRTFQTFSILFQNNPIDIYINDSFDERDFGIAYLRNDKDIIQCDHEFGTKIYENWNKEPAYFIPPLGESLYAVWERTISALKETMHEFEGADVLLLIHGETGNMVCAYANGIRNVEDYLKFKETHWLKNLEFRHYEMNESKLKPLKT